MVAGLELDDDFELVSERAWVNLEAGIGDDTLSLSTLGLSTNRHLLCGFPEFQQPLHKNLQRFLKVCSDRLAARESLTMQA